MLTSKLFCSILSGVSKRGLMSKNQFHPKIFNDSRKLHFTALKQLTIELRTYEELEAYFAESPSSLAIFDFYDYSDALSKMQSSRLQSKVDCSDVEVDLVHIDVVSSVELAEYFQIDIVPTLITFINSEAFERIDGNANDEELEDVIHALIEQTNEEQES